MRDEDIMDEESDTLPDDLSNDDSQARSQDGAKDETIDENSHDDNIALSQLSPSVRRTRRRLADNEEDHLTADAVPLMIHVKTKDFTRSDPAEYVDASTDDFTARVNRRNDATPFVDSPPGTRWEYKPSSVPAGAKLYLGRDHTCTAENVAFKASNLNVEVSFPCMVPLAIRIEQ
jgi:hypothetical protein